MHYPLVNEYVLYDYMDHLKVCILQIEERLLCIYMSILLCWLARVKYRIFYSLQSTQTKHVLKIVQSKHPPRV